MDEGPRRSLRKAVVGIRNGGFGMGEGGSVTRALGGFFVVGRLSLGWVVFSDLVRKYSVTQFIEIV